MAEEFAAALAACLSMDAVKDCFRGRIALYGFNASACGAFLPTDNGPETHFFFQDWPPAWIELYVKRNFVAADYGVAEARRRIAPFTWLEAKAERTLSRAEQEIWDTACEWGWTDGFSVPIHGPGGYFGLVTMAGKERRMTPALRGELHQLAFLTHERCRALTGLTPVTAPAETLTHRELECIRWVVAGKTDAEIANLTSLLFSEERRVRQNRYAHQWFSLGREAMGRVGAWRDDMTILPDVPTADAWLAKQQSAR